jgi:hypothetical protein
MGTMRQAVAEQHGVQVYAIVLLRAGSIPKTSSGKIQRYASREGFLTQTLEVVGKWQAPLTPASHDPVSPPVAGGTGQSTCDSKKQLLRAMLSHSSKGLPYRAVVGG